MVGCGVGMVGDDDRSVGWLVVLRGNSFVRIGE